jgi:hypothetical protein
MGGQTLRLAWSFGFLVGPNRSALHFTIFSRSYFARVFSTSFRCSFLLGVLHLPIRFLFCSVQNELVLVTLQAFYSVNTLCILHEKRCVQKVKTVRSEDVFLLPGGVYWFQWYLCLLSEVAVYTSIILVEALGASLVLDQLTLLRQLRKCLVSVIFGF